MSKIAGKDVTFYYADEGSPVVEEPAFDFNLDQVADEIDVTDSESGGESREYLDGYQNRTFTFSQWFNDGDTALELGDLKDFEIHIGTKKKSGTFLVLGATLGATREDATRWNITARVTGPIITGAV